MDGYLNVVERRMDDLIKISIQERKSKGFGVLFIDFTKENEMNCFYLLIDDKKLQNKLILNGKKRIKEFETARSRAKKYIMLCEKIVNV